MASTMACLPVFVHPIKRTNSSPGKYESLSLLEWPGLRKTRPRRARCCQVKTVIFAGFAWFAGFAGFVDPEISAFGNPSWTGQVVAKDNAIAESLGDTITSGKQNAIMISRSTVGK